MGVQTDPVGREAGVPGVAGWCRRRRGATVEHVTATPTFTVSHGPVDETGRLLHEGDLAAQLALTVTNLESALAGRSRDWSHVVELRVGTTDPAGLADVVDTLDERLVQSGASPSVSVVPEPALALPGMAVALDAVVSTAPGTATDSCISGRGSPHA